jgi:hypothetical protein
LSLLPCPSLLWFLHLLGGFGRGDLHLQYPPIQSSSKWGELVGSRSGVIGWPPPLFFSSKSSIAALVGLLKEWFKHFLSVHSVHPYIVLSSSL